MNDWKFSSPTPEQDLLFDAQHLHMTVEAEACDTQENQDSLYQDTRVRPVMGQIVELDKAKKIHLTITDVTDPVQAIAAMHPEIATAAFNHGAKFLDSPDLRRLDEMKKYFGHGSGVYLVTADFLNARTEAFKLDERAQKKITKALNEKSKKKTKKKVSRVSKVRRSGSRAKR